MTLNRIPRVALAVALCAACAAPVMAQTPPPAPSAPVQSAPLERALEAIIPAPFAIEVDRKIPRDWIVHWSPAGENWLRSLRSALEPMGLSVQADWSRSVVRIYGPQVAQQAQPEGQPRLKAVDVGAADAVKQWPDLGAVSSAAWSEKAPTAPKSPMLLGRALSSVVPPEFSRMETEYLGIDPAVSVVWSGKTRLDALRSIEQQINAQVKLAASGLQVRSNSYKPAAPAAAPTQPARPQTFALVGGASLQSQLSEWAKRAGWALVWHLDSDWIVPNGGDFGPSFVNAARLVVESMRANGEDVRATFHEGNRTLVIGVKR